MASSKITGRIWILFAAVLWSLSGFFAKSPILDEWPAEDRGLLLAFWRAFFACVVLLPAIGKPKLTWRLLPAAACFAVMNITFLMAMTTTTAANAIWLQYTAPAWVLLVGVGLLGEQAVQRDYWMVGLAMVGVALILGFEWSRGPEAARDRAGCLWALAAGISFAGVMLSLRRVADLRGAWVITVCHFAAAIVLAPWAISHYGLPSPKTASWVAAFGSLQMALPYVLFTRGLRTITSHEASCIALLEPLLVPLWVFLFWSSTPDYRPPAWWTWAGGMFMLAGLLVRYWPATASEPSTSSRQDDA